MKGSKEVKYIVSALAVLIIILFLGTYFGILNPNFLRERPYKIIKPTNGYEPGTTISLYENSPPDFPKSIIGNHTLTHSEVVKFPDGGEQTTISYKTEVGPLETATSFVTSLPKAGWAITASKLSDQVSVIEAAEGSKKIIVTVSRVGKVQGSLVTMQYNP